MTTAAVLVHYPNFYDQPPSVFFWVEQGRLKEYAPNPDAYSVDRARMMVNRKREDVPWIDQFNYLGEKNPNPSHWEVYYEVEDLQEFFAAFRPIPSERG